MVRMPRRRQGAIRFFLRRRQTTPTFREDRASSSAEVLEVAPPEPIRAEDSVTPSDAHDLADAKVEDLPGLEEFAFVAHGGDAEAVNLALQLAGGDLPL